MSRRAERLADEVGLAATERSYLVEVDRELAGAPGVPRRGFLAETAEMLAERPEAARFDELEEAFGPPADHARAWRERSGFDGAVAPWRRWWLLPRWSRLAQVALVIVLALGGSATWNYFTAEPTVSNNCTGVVVSELEELDWRDAAGVSEVRVAVDPGERFGVSLCPHAADPALTFERVRVPLGRSTNFQPVGWEVSTGASLEWTGDAGNHRSWRMDEVEAGWANVVVWFEMADCLPEGAGLGFDRVMIDYRYRGRRRSTQVPLVSTVTVVGTADCTDERRAADRREVEAWSAVTGPMLYPRPAAIEPLGPLELDPFNVSDDLCRYLRGVVPVDGYEHLEPLGARAVFRLEDTEMAATLIDGAVLGICPEFADQRDELLALLGT